MIPKTKFPVCDETDLHVRLRAKYPVLFRIKTSVRLRKKPWAHLATKPLVVSLCARTNRSWTTNESENVATNTSQNAASSTSQDRCIRKVLYWHLPHPLGEALASVPRHYASALFDLQNCRQVRNHVFIPVHSILVFLRECRGYVQASFCTVHDTKFNGKVCARASFLLCDFVHPYRL